MKTHDYYGTTQSPWRRALARIAATGAVAALTACQTPATHERPHGTVLGRVKASGTVGGAVMVIAVDRRTGHIAQRAFLEQATAFAMPLHSGSYKFYACADANRDGRCGREEAHSVTYALADEVHAGDVIQMPTLILRRDTVAAAR